MTGIPDIDVHKMYIGNEEPKDDRSIKQETETDGNPKRN